MLLSYAISIVGIILLWLLQFYPNFWLLTAFVVTFGSMIGSRGPLITATAMKIFRGERVARSTARSRSAAVLAQGSAPGPAA